MVYIWNEVTQPGLQLRFPKGKVRPKNKKKRKDVCPFLTNPKYWQTTVLFCFWFCFVLFCFVFAFFAFLILNLVFVNKNVKIKCQNI